MEFNETLNKVNDLITERDKLVKDYNLTILTFLQNTAFGICDALGTDPQHVTIYNVYRDEHYYVFHTFMHDYGTSKEESIGTELYLDIPNDVVMCNNRDDICTYIQHQILLNKQDDQPRVLH